ncbi:MAG: helix-turn-helix transcriptional regulator [Alphaproteobacteria bacterium]
MMDDDADSESGATTAGQGHSGDWVIPVPASGPPAFAVLPWPLFVRLRRLAREGTRQTDTYLNDGIRVHDSDTISSLQGWLDDTPFREAGDSLMPEDGEFGGDDPMPLAVMDRLLDGDHPLKVFRNHRGLSQKELAARTGLNATYLSQIETRKRGGSTRVYRLLAAALNVDIGDLIE